MTDSDLSLKVNEDYGIAALPKDKFKIGNMQTKYLIPNLRELCSGRQTLVLSRFSVDI